MSLTGRHMPNKNILLPQFRVMEFVTTTNVNSTATVDEYYNTHLQIYINISLGSYNVAYYVFFFVGFLLMLTILSCE